MRQGLHICKIKKTVISIVVTVIAAFILSACSFSMSDFKPAGAGMPEEIADETGISAGILENTDEILPIETGIAEISKYGNIVLEISPDTMKAQGYDEGDIVTVTAGSVSIEMPIGTNFGDVDSGLPICCYRFSLDPAVPSHTTLAINAGDLAGAMGIASKESISEDPGYRWNWNEGFDENVTVRISIAEKQGYADEYEIRKAMEKGSLNRADYPGLTDEEYANFRMIHTGGMGEGILFRSSSPVSPKINRNAEADEALYLAGVKTILNMSDFKDTMEAYPDYWTTHYSGCDIIALDMGMDFFDGEFEEKMAEGIRFMLSHDGPYLIHCIEGKDRTGFMSAVLECLMGASAEEVVRDYMLTFENYYNVERDSEIYRKIVSSNIEKNLCRAFGIESIYEADLSECAQEYLKRISLTDEEIGQLKEILG